MQKRVFDILIASILVVLTLPIMVVSAIASAVMLRAWPFFVQRRVGLNGREFRFIKIRTLPTSTPAYVLKNELHVEELPRFLRLMRLLHIDELPQLFLVISGRLSMVGPRPEMTAFHGRLDPDFAEARTSVRPGCTGLWQIGLGCVGLIGDAPEYDRFYLRHRARLLDIWVLTRTALLMLGISGLVSLEDVPDWAADERPVRASVPAELVELAEVD
jgi:lipopolysaccharide/colanic/teichoic acid biosynthesis glycosyltransferase